MRSLRHYQFATVLVALVALATTSPRASSARSASVVRTRPSEDAREIARIRAHFDSVLLELTASTAGGPLAAPIATQRATLAETLRAYRDRGVFPHNYDFPGRAVPYFVDRRTGTLCAVAHLLESTGRRDIVDRVAAADNNVWVAQLAGDSAFNGWLRTNGLTLAEAARIQVPYVGPPPNLEPNPPQTATPSTHGTVSLAVAPLALGSALTGIMNALSNADGHQRATRIVGLASGLASVAVGAGLAARSDSPRQLGLATTAIGGLSIAFASRATRRHHAVVAHEREAARARAIQASISPIVGTGSASSAGLAFSIRY